MKTEYVQTNFPEITDQCRRAWEIKGQAHGKRYIPLARGERPPETVDHQALDQEEPDEVPAEPERRGFLGRLRDDDER